jgi:hypothetical protein
VSVIDPTTCVVGRTGTPDNWFASSLVGSGGFCAGAVPRRNRAAPTTRQWAGQLSVAPGTTSFSFHAHPQTVAAHRKMALTSENATENAAASKFSRGEKSFGFQSGGYIPSWWGVFAGTRFARPPHPPVNRGVSDSGRRDDGAGAVLPVSAAAVRSHVGPGRGWCAVLPWFTCVEHGARYWD